tara:strand:+ start:303 stop:482 length:180 start_codon:yes stop_codon:yes gene_type:complete
VVRVAKEKGFVHFSVDDNIRITKTIEIDADSFHKISFNPTLQLIDQEESTLVQLLNIFK